MKNIYVILALIIIFVGAYLQWFFCCHGIIEKKFPLDIKDGQKQVVFNPKNFHFLEGESGFASISESLHSSLDSVTDFLNINPDKLLKIKGLYNDKETEQIGLSRAENVKNWFIEKGIESYQLATETQHESGLITDENNQLRGATLFTVEQLSDFFGKFKVEDKQGNFSYESNDNFNFRPSLLYFEEPLSQEIRDGVLAINQYLVSNPDKMLEIKGYYHSEERNVSVFDNLGIARANTIKDFFVAQGGASNQFLTKGEVRDAYNLHAPLLKGAVSFSILTKSQEEKEKFRKELLAFGRNLNRNPLIIYFDTGKSKIDLTVEEREKLAKIAQYVDHIDNAKVLIVGHTDNVGDAKKNLQLGQFRADALKKYLVAHGFAEKLVNTISKGQTKPIASNKKEEGRAKNRRAEISVRIEK